jgi:hypothetical protein
MSDERGSTCYIYHPLPEALAVDPAVQRTLADRMLAEKIMGVETYGKLT